MDANNETITNIPKGSIILKNKIYMPYDNKEGEIPDNSIIYNNMIFIEFKSLNPFQVENNMEVKNEDISNSKIINNKEKRKNNPTLEKKNNKRENGNNKSDNIKSERKNFVSEDTQEETLFKKMNKYYYNCENNKMMKYSLNRINKSTRTNKYNSVSYNCYETYCSGRAHGNIIYTKINNDKEILEIKNFTLKTAHSIAYEDHIYVIYNQIENDIKNNTIDTEKLKTVIYARAYFINKLKNSQYIQLTKIEIDFINQYHIKEFSSRFNEQIKIPLKKIISSAQLLLKRTEELNNFSINNILDLTDYNNGKIVQKLTCKYMKNNLIKEDLIYLILTKNIKDNLNNEIVNSIFIDCTYKIIPPGLRDYKFLVIVGYDNIKDKLNLYLFALIKHENKETFECILNYLKINFNFNPKNRVNVII